MGSWCPRTGIRSDELRCSSNASKALRRRYSEAFCGLSHTGRRSWRQEHKENTLGTHTEAAIEKTPATFSSKVLDLDVPRVVRELEDAIHTIVLRRLRRKGAVVGLSGGIDSSVTAALCAQALGKDKVFGVMMPEHESSGESLDLA